MSVRVRGCLFAALCVAASFGAAAAQPGPWPFGPKPPGLFRVTDGGGGYGFIDERGQLRIGFEALRHLAVVENFSEGLAAACPRDAKTGYCSESGFGYIDETGAFVIPPRFKVAGLFDGGLAFVHAGPGAGGGFINRRGELVIKVGEGEAASRFYEGLALVRSGFGARFIDRSGRVVAEWKGGVVGEFSEGLAGVVEGRGRDARYGYIDRSGRLVIAPRFEPEREHHGFILAPHPFSGGRACVKVGKTYGFIDRKGDLVIPAEFAAPSYFYEGFACVWRPGESFAEFIDANGRRAFGRTFDRCTAFHGGLAAVAVRQSGVEKWGYIDRSGRFVIEPRFDEAYPFQGALAQVATSEGERPTPETYARRRWGYIDRSGAYVWRGPLK